MEPLRHNQLADGIFPQYFIDDAPTRATVTWTPAMPTSTETIRQTLLTLTISDGRHRLADLAAIDGIALDPDGMLRVSLAVDPGQGPVLEDLRQAAERALHNLPGISASSVILTARRKPGAEANQPRPASAGPHHGSNEPVNLPDIRHIIAIASGKGGVGKSTVAANLAVAMASRGLKVGLLDADIHGPSVPTLIGVDGKPSVNADKRIVPIEAHGIRAMSIGYMIEPGQALIWRGPMLQGALMQLLRDVAWGPLDLLILDLPPGTGDVQLSLSQKLGLSGAVIVSTPQDLALIDARRAMAMFDKLSVPLLGLIENMSVFTCPHCGHDSHIFGHGGAEQEAASRGLPFLGAVPLTMALRELADSGEPAVAARPDDPVSRAFGAIADTLAAQLVAR